MGPLALGAAALLLLSLSQGENRPVQPPKPKPDPNNPAKDYVRSLVRSEAARQGVPVPVALAVAELESGFDPRAPGDLDWSKRRGGELYQKLVLDNPRLARNPARDDPSAWHSYGVFQLLAPHFVEPLEHPSALYDAQTNVTRGVNYLRRLLARYGDPVSARLAYIGCPPGHCSEAACDVARAKFRKALAKWENA